MDTDPPTRRTGCCLICSTIALFFFMGEIIRDLDGPPRQTWIIYVTYPFSASLYNFYMSAISLNSISPHPSKQSNLLHLKHIYIDDLHIIHVQKNGRKELFVRFTEGKFNHPPNYYSWIKSFIRHKEQTWVKTMDISRVRWLGQCYLDLSPIAFLNIVTLKTVNYFYNLRFFFSSIKYHNNIILKLSIPKPIFAFYFLFLQGSTSQIGVCSRSIWRTC